MRYVSFLDRVRKYLVEQFSRQMFWLRGDNEAARMSWPRPGVFERERNREPIARKRDLSIGSKRLGEGDQITEEARL